jgi:hypothetical protein
MLEFNAQISVEINICIDSSRFKLQISLSVNTVPKHPIKNHKSIYKFNTLNTHIHDFSLSRLVTGTSIKG